MNIVFIPKNKGKSCSFRFTSKGFYILLGFLVSFPLLLGAGGYVLGLGDAEPGPWAMVKMWEKQLSDQKVKVEFATKNADENIEALSRRLAELQAHVIRLDALGSRLTKVAKLDEGEFDFDSRPAQGGPENADAPTDTIVVADFMESLNQLSEQLENRSQQLGLLETMLMSRQLDDEIMPAGRPVQKGWLSSHYGIRNDPFTGRPEMHKGVDFAGKAGSNVVTVAAGVVTWAGSRWGYGNLVEINHGNGYATRYGHNSEVLVKVGDTVKKGDAIALMGSTGRSTGPHVHFEVWHDGRVVDPLQYIKTASR